MLIPKEAKELLERLDDLDYLAPFNIVAESAPPGSPYRFSYSKTPLNLDRYFFELQLDEVKIVSGSHDCPGAIRRLFWEKIYPAMPK